MICGEVDWRGILATVGYLRRRAHSKLHTAAPLRIKLAGSGTECYMIS